MEAAHQRFAVFEMKEIVLVKVLTKISADAAA